MTLKLPDKVDVGGKIYTVQYPYVFKGIDELYGLHSPYDHTIKVEKNEDQLTLTTFMHEMLHAIDCVYNNYGLSDDEAIHDRLTHGLYNLFALNDLLENKTIPEQIEILGILFKINYNMEVADNIKEYHSCIMMKTGTISISNNITGRSPTLDIQKIEIIKNVLFIIGYLFSCDLEFMKDNVVNHSLSLGIYYTFKKIKMEKMIKSVRRSLIKCDGKNKTRPKKKLG